MFKTSDLLRCKVHNYLSKCKSAEIEQFCGIISMSKMARDFYLESIKEDLESETLGESAPLKILYGDKARDELEAYYQTALYMVDMVNSIDSDLLEVILSEICEDE